MPYVIKERCATGGREMYLKERPLMSNSLGVWALNLKKAQLFLTHLAATTACEMLALCNAGSVIYISDSKMKMEAKKVGFKDTTKWVIQSNVTGDYLASVTAARQLERWVAHIRNAILFDTLDEARKLVTEFVIGISNNPAALDIDYIQIDSISHRTVINTADELIRFPEPRNPKRTHYVVKCQTSNLFFEKHAEFGKAEKWTIVLAKAEKFKHTTAASSAILKMAHEPNVRIIEVMGLIGDRTIPVELGDALSFPAELDDALSGKKNFRIKMRHGVGVTVEKTFVDITEVEAVNKMFEAVVDAQEGRFDIGTIEEVGKALTASKAKAAVEARDHKSM